MKFRKITTQSTVFTRIVSILLSRDLFLVFTSELYVLSKITPEVNLVSSSDIGILVLIINILVRTELHYIKCILYSNLVLWCAFQLYINWNIYVLVKLWTGNTISNCIWSDTMFTAFLAFEYRVLNCWRLCVLKCFVFCCVFFSSDT